MLDCIYIHYNHSPVSRTKDLWSNGRDTRTDRQQTYMSPPVSSISEHEGDEMSHHSQSMWTMRDMTEGMVRCVLPTRGVQCTGGTGL
jgi:hypothetical protein